jgi:opacity protein-like surface antigen
MMRIARVVPILFAITVCCAAALQAQPAAAQAATDSRGYAEFTVGPTFGHKSDVAVGAEGGWALKRDLDVFVEFGHIGNAASSDLESRANSIANSVGGTANVIAKVNYFDVGVRYRFVVNNPRLHPYVAVGLGAAFVTTETTVTINGSPAPPDLIAFGTDLNGSQTSFHFTLGGGTTIDFGTRYFGDVSYRWGHVSGKSDSSGGETVTTLEGFNTNRLQLGLGIRF